MRPLGSAYEDQDLVFADELGRIWRPDKVTGAFRRAVKQAKLAVPFHSLRHTHATMLLAEGVHPKIVSERLGHGTISITMDLYSHVTPTMQEEAAARVDAAMGL